MKKKLKKMKMILEENNLPKKSNLTSSFINAFLGPCNSILIDKKLNNFFI